MMDISDKIKIICSSAMFWLRFRIADFIMPVAIKNKVAYSLAVDSCLYEVEQKLNSIQTRNKPKQDSETDKRFQEMNPRADELNKLGKYNGLPDWHPANGSIDYTPIREVIQKI